MWRFLLQGFSHFYARAPHVQTLHRNKLSLTQFCKGTVGASLAQRSPWGSNPQPVCVCVCMCVVQMEDTCVVACAWGCKPCSRGGGGGWIVWSVIKRQGTRGEWEHDPWRDSRRNERDPPRHTLITTTLPLSIWSFALLLIHPWRHTNTHTHIHKHIFFTPCQQTLTYAHTHTYTYTHVEEADGKQPEDLMNFCLCNFESSVSPFGSRQVQIRFQIRLWLHCVMTCGRAEKTARALKIGQMFLTAQHIGGTIVDLACR